MQVKSKRIAIVSSSFPPLGGGGVSSSHYNLFVALKKRGANVKAYTCNDGGTKKIENEEDVVRGGLQPLLVKLINMVVFTAFRLTGEKGRVYQFSDAITGSIGGLLLRRKIRKFEPDIVIIPDQGAPGVFLPRLKNSRIVLVSHHNPARFLDEPLFGLHSHRDARLALKLEHLALKRVNGVICPSQYMKEAFLKTYSFNGPIDVVPNIVDASIIIQVEKSFLREKAGLPMEAPIVYIPSAGSDFKGRQFVFEIIRRLSSCYEKEIGFYLSGDIGIELVRIFSFLPENVHLITPGKTSYKENISNIKSCTLCVSPTLIDNFSMAILEAQLCGLPVVTFDVGGNKEIVRDGKTGYIVPLVDMERFISLSHKLLHDEQLCLELGSQARNLEKRFDKDLIIERFIHFCEKL